MRSFCVRSAFRKALASRRFPGVATSIPRPIEASIDRTPIGSHDQYRSLINALWRR